MKTVDIEAFSQQFKFDIGNMMLKKHRIYLDTKYWIFMRDASLERAAAIQTEIYKNLKYLIEKEIAICPLSPHIFLELMKQKDKQTRLATAMVMDELSQQVCFVSPLDIVGQELLIFVRQCQAKTQDKPLFSPAKYVWTKVAFVMGKLYPTLEGIADDQMNEIRIQFFDFFSKLTLVKMLNFMKDDFPLMNSKTLVEQLNQGKDNNQNWKSFHEVFMHEIGGVLDVVKDDLEQLRIYLFKNDAGGSITLEGVLKSESAKLLSNSIYNAFDQKKVSKELPFFHINASLHAFMRYNKCQRYDENDLTDFSHVAWALPYCNTFLTEKPLHDWICSKLLKLDKVYGTKVLWKEDNVLTRLEQIINSA